MIQTVSNNTAHKNVRSAIQPNAEEIALGFTSRRINTILYNLNKVMDRHLTEWEAANN